MGAQAASFVLGYHGCEKTVGEAILAGERDLERSENDYDWLGPGVYFGEADPKRGLAWAEQQVSRGRYTEPFVIGAIIDLGDCLDLMSQNGIQAVSAAYDSLQVIHDAVPELGPLPRNLGGPDLLKRHLDCAVVRHVHEIRKAFRNAPFQTVRGLFREGSPIYPDSGFYQRTHAQIAVCDLKQIKGVFRVRSSDLL